MNINNNADFYTGSGSLNDCYRQQNDRLTGTERIRCFYSRAQSQDVERCPITFRPMDQHRPKAYRKDIDCRSVKNAKLDEDEMKVQPYQYTKPSDSSNGKEYCELTVQWPCTDDVRISPPIELPTSTYDIQNHTEHFQYQKQRPAEPLFHRNLIEVGHEWIPMSGVDETSFAHKKGRTIDTTCVECETVLFALETASMVVCPLCRCVSPIECSSMKKLLPTTDVHAGIGLPIDFVISLE